MDETTQLKLLNKLRKMRTQAAVASFAAVSKDEILNSHITESVCHANISAYLPNKVDYIVTSNNCDLFAKRHSLIYGGEWIDRWLEWLIKESPYRWAFVSGIELAKAKGFVLRTDIPGNYLNGALMLTRQMYDGRGGLLSKYWLPLVDAGVDPTFAAATINLIHDFRLRLGGTSSNHYPFRTSILTGELKRILTFDFNKPNWKHPSPTFRRYPNRYRLCRVDGLWRDNRERQRYDQVLSNNYSDNLGFKEVKSSFGSTVRLPKPMSKQQFLEFFKAESDRMLEQ